MSEQPQDITCEGGLMLPPLWKILGLPEPTEVEGQDGEQPTPL